jgi:2-polyprenyl-3-methyl-5-hydroxy-6-metoxy-1,4-benzoquinol methylase
MQLETLKECPVCKSNQFKSYLNVVDYTVSKKRFNIQECNSCSFLFTNPRPSENEIGYYYESQEYISHHDDAKGFMSKVYKTVRDHTIGEKIKMINGLNAHKGNLLDIGCGTGNFVQACKVDGWHITGVEPDQGARKVASERVGQSIFQNIFEPEITAQKYDIITMWHVLEHVHLLNETISWLKAHLKPGGKILIAVPNPASHDAKKYGEFWAAYDVPRHLYHFTEKTMKTLMQNHGLHVEKVFPMWFDSFYVSMLSTKYQSGSTKMFDSMLTGLISNVKGNGSEASSTNTSSLIYLISTK